MAETSADSAVPELERLVVHASRLESSNSSVTRLAAGDFAGLHVDLPGVLEQVSGVTVRRTGGLGEYAEASIRGNAARQVQIYLDGIPLNTAAGGAVDLSKVPLGALEAVTVYKAVAPLELSEAGAGAVISLSSAGEADVSAMTLEAGSFGYHRAGALLGRQFQRWSHRLSIDYEAADNNYPFLYDRQTDRPDDDTWETKDNNRHSSFAALYAGSVRIGQQRSLRGMASFAAYRKELYQEFLAEQEQQVEVSGRTLLGSLRYDREAGRLSGALELRGRYVQTLFQDPLGQYYLGGAKKSDDRMPWVRAAADGRWQAAGPLALRGRGSVGYETYRSENLLYGGAADAPFAQRLSVTGAAEASCDIPDRLHAGFRYTHVYTYSSGNMSQIVSDQWQEKSAHHPNGSFECLWDIRPWLGVDLLGRMERLPVTFTQYFGKGMDIPNADLAPERQREYSAGVRSTVGPFSLSASFFHGLVQDFITRQELSTHVFKAVNLGEIRRLGAECETRLLLGRRVRIDNSLQYVHTRMLETAYAYARDKNVPYQPAFHDYLRATLDLDWFVIGHTLSYVSPYYTDLQNLPENLQRPKPTLGLVVRTGRIPHLTLTYRMDNYLDEHNEFYPEQPLPGRMHYVSGQVAF